MREADYFLARRSFNDLMGHPVATRPLVSILRAIIEVARHTIDHASTSTNVLKLQQQVRNFGNALKDHPDRVAISRLLPEPVRRMAGNDAVLVIWNASTRLRPLAEELLEKLNAQLYENNGGPPTIAEPATKRRKSQEMPAVGSSTIN